MPDFKAMYIKLFQSQTKAIRILQEAQLETEDMYIEAEPPDIRVLTTLNDNSDANTETDDGHERKD